MSFLEVLARTIRCITNSEPIGILPNIWKGPISLGSGPWVNLLPVANNPIWKCPVFPGTCITEQEEAMCSEESEEKRCGMEKRSIVSPLLKMVFWVGLLF